MGNEAADAKQFAEWEVDYVKLDGCYSNVRHMDYGKLICKTVVQVRNEFIPTWFVVTFTVRV